MVCICFFSSPVEYSDGDPVVQTWSVALALLCSFLLGFGDASINTQVRKYNGPVWWVIMHTQLRNVW